MSHACTACTPVHPAGSVIVYPYVADLNVVGSAVVDGDALDGDDAASALLAAGDDDGDEPLPLQDVMTKVAVSISAAVAPALLITGHALFG